MHISSKLIVGLWLVLAVYLSMDFFGLLKRTPPPVNGLEFVAISPKDGNTPSFKVSKFETTLEQYLAFLADVGLGGSEDFQKRKDLDLKLPVTQVKKTDARAFAAWLTYRQKAAGNIAKDLEYRLPTDVEWTQITGEAASTESGTTPEEKMQKKTRVVFIQGDSALPAPSAGNVLRVQDDTKPVDSTTAKESQKKGFDTSTDRFLGVAPVGRYESSKTGLKDLLGNVAEMVEDAYNEKGQLVTVRGGSFKSSDASELEISWRGSEKDGAADHVGFRLVLAKVVGQTN